MTHTQEQDQPQNSDTVVKDLRSAKQVKLEALKVHGLNPYPHVYDRTHMAKDLQEKYKDLADGTETEDRVSVAGRAMAIRNNGMFIDLMDTSGRIQIFSHKQSMSEDILAKLKFMDLGDVIGVEGTMRRTPRGELSVRATDIHILTKSLQTLPEKHHGLTDIEQRYRQRYVDLIMNEKSRDTLRARSKIVSFIRRYMEDMGALEVETPMLHPIMGGASAKPFTTHHNALDSNFYLRVAPELYLKRLVVGGLADDVFEINRCFRNEGISIKHNPEFTMIEGYHAYKDYKDIMDMIEDLVGQTIEHLHGSRVIEVQGQELDFSKPWRRCSMCDLVKDETGLDFIEIKTAEEARGAALRLGIHVEETANWGQVVEACFDEKVEHKLIQPTHVTDHPFEISPLAKNHRDNPRLVERFESFVNGWEVANAFTELNDPAIQRARFEEQVKMAEQGDDEAQMLDEDYITALEFGLPPTAGWGFGIDRLTMLLTNSHNIRDVICFPTLRPVFSKTEASTLSPPSSVKAPEAPLHNMPESVDMDDGQYRFVVVVNGKEESSAKLINAVGHSMVGLSGGVAKDENKCLIDYQDSEGSIHPSISHYPVIVLKAKNSNQIRKIRQQAVEKDFLFTDFTKDMQLGSSKEQMASLRLKKDEDVEYLAISLFGKTEDLKELTGKLSLYR